MFLLSHEQCLLADYHVKTIMLVCYDLKRSTNHLECVKLVEMDGQITK